MLTSTSIAVSRIMFSIHSLADKVGSDSAWLLSNFELSRAGWRQGAHEGELIVEWDTTYTGDKVNPRDRNMTQASAYPMRVTQVGAFEDYVKHV